MEITKRNGRSETYDGHKIITAMKKALESTGSNPAPLLWRICFMP